VDGEIEGKGEIKEFLMRGRESQEEITGKKRKNGRVLGVGSVISLDHPRGGEFSEGFEVRFKR